MFLTEILQIRKNITKKKAPMSEHEKYRNIKNKFEKHFSEKPGK